MALKLEELDDLLGYDPATHSIQGLPTLAAGVASNVRNRPTPRIPSMAAAPPPEPSAIQPLAPGSDQPALASNIPTMQQPARPAPQGFWGKLGHGLEKAADIGLTTFTPGVAAEMPWTALGKKVEEKRQAGLEAEKARTGFEQAETEASQVENKPVTWTTPSGENVTIPTREWGPLEQAKETQEAETARVQDKVQKGDWVTGIHDGTP
jgi:hypothetical protein